MHSSLEYYFNTVKTAPLAMSINEVENLVNTYPLSTNGGWQNTLNQSTLVKIAAVTLAAVTAAAIVYSLWSSKPSEPYSEIQSPRGNQVAIVTDSSETSPFGVTNQALSSEQFKDSKKANSNCFDVESDKSPKPINEPSKNQDSVAEFTIADSNSSRTNRSVFQPVSNHIVERAVITQESLQVEDFVNVGDTIYSDGGEKTFVKVIDADQIEWLKLEHKKGNVRIKTHDKQQIIMTAKVKVQCRSSDEEEMALNDFDLNLVKQNNAITTAWNWENIKAGNCSCNKNGGKVELENGETIKVNKLTIDYEFAVPKGLSHDIKLKYGDFVMESTSGQVKLSMFHSTFKTEGIDNDLEAKFKYSKGNMGDFKSADVKSFQSTVELGTGESLDLDAKYSTLILKGLETLETESFQTNIDFNGGASSIEGNFKYSNLKLAGTVEELDIEAFQSNMTFLDVNRADLEASYCTFEIRESEVINTDNLFQSKLVVDRVGSFTGDLKYTNIKMEQLDKEAEFSSFQGKIKINKVSAGFQKLSVNAKYTPVYLGMSPDSKYELISESVYTKLRLPQSKFDEYYRNQQNQKIELKGGYNVQAGSELSRVEIEAFQGEVIID
jgi:hypothetical protein